MHEIVDLIANYVFGAASAAASVVCVAFSMPLLFLLLLRWAHTHTHTISANKSGKRQFSSAEERQDYFYTFPMWFGCLKPDEGTSAKSSPWRRPLSFDSRMDEAIHSHTYCRQNNQENMFRLEKPSYCKCVYSCRIFAVGPYQAIFIKWCYTANVRLA